VSRSFLAVIELGRARALVGGHFLRVIERAALPASSKNRLMRPVPM
jgi:hypothetical protein